MRVSRTPPEIILDQVQREQLEALTRASSASQAEVLRARIILLAALNRTNEEIADKLPTTEQTVCKWRRRFARLGLAGLRDHARSGRPARVSASALNTVLTKVTQPPKAGPDGVAAAWPSKRVSPKVGFNSCGSAT